MPRRRLRALLLVVGLTTGAVLLGGWPTASVQGQEPAAGAGAIDLTVAPGGAIIRGAPLFLDVTVDGLAAGATLPARVSVDGEAVGEVELVAGSQRIKLEEARLGPGRHTVRVEALAAAGAAGDLETGALPGWLSLLPPLVAIGLALLFKEVLIALFTGVFIGVLTLYPNPIVAFAKSGSEFIVPAVANDAGRLKIIVFSLLLGGMVGVISKSGGSRGIVDRLAPYATNPRRGQLATWVMGVLIFFDDYANTLLVGSTMRPITDRLRISREKLAYIVDSTAAPIASVIPISTWIGFELGLIQASFDKLGLPYGAYPTFVDSIPYRFYPILALVLGFTIAFSCRDLGPMLKAERRASETGEVLARDQVPLADYTSGELAPRDDIEKRAINALVPVAAVIAVTMIGLWVTGSAGTDRADFETTGAWLRQVFAQADSYNALLWASMTGVLLAIALPVAQRLMPAKEAIDGMIAGIRSMLLAIVVLVLAWSLSGVCDALHTAEYLVGLTDGVLSPYLLPALVFVISAAVAFATGTSWGAMGILVPLVIPISHGLASGAGLPVDSHGYYTLMLGTISSVLAGSVWGDHCSPISDTTILSSMATGCDHVAHVRTQLPYALGIGLVGILLGDLPTAFGLSPWISLIVASALIVGVVLWRGKRSDWSAAQAEEAG